MKAYTDIEQSRKLAEILPTESADQTWERIAIAGANLDVPEEMEYWHNGNAPCILNSKIGIPCWSLTSLLDALPVSVDEGQHCLALINSNPNGDIEWLCCYEDDNGNLLMECYADNQVDACVEMILKLKEKELL